ncbi:hypothetical protein QEV68_05400 [Trueperella pyogenes]|uniref:hypothetical protein n=1 Tax=Trueperella pyogenes TaxID=1661 RepID=UPI00324D44F2
MPNNEFGDFQTPLELAVQCLRVLDLPSGARVLEPTCGRGAFLRGAKIVTPETERRGIEINQSYVEEAASWGEVRKANIFRVSLLEESDWGGEGPLFVVGNPPWVTAAELKRMGSENLPSKENFKAVKGLEAILGSSNFDVCEYIILKILRELSSLEFTFGMLCKTQVARNVIEYAERAQLPISNAACYRIDAKKWFGASVDACWFTLESQPQKDPDYTVAVYEDLFNPDSGPISRFGVLDSLLVSDIEKYNTARDADGVSPYEWRSGLKHDASSVFELRATPNPTTKDGEILDLEKDYVYPFLKSTDVFRGRQRELTKWVVVPQLEFGADTSHLRTTAPRLWSYLEKNADILDSRKSSIYRNRPRFSVFGHGVYTFAPYKVAVSGLHKEPVFRLVAPLEGRPVVLDDTCYFIPFLDPTEAVLVAAILNSPAALDLIESLVFWDAKRPITKKLLARIDLNKLPFDAASVLLKARDLAEESGVQFDVGRADLLIGSLGKKDVEMDALF